MASDVTVNYKIAYEFTFDIEVARLRLPDLWEEAEGDDETFIEFVRDHVVARLDDYEWLKRKGFSLPNFLTHFTVQEEID